MMKRLLLAVLLAATLLPLAGCRLFQRDCEYDSRRNSERDCR